MSNVIIPSEESKLREEEEQLAEITKVKPAPDLMGIAETHQLLANSPAPDPIPEWVHKSLLNIGGTNRFGGPMFKAVYGQTETQFAYGQLRLKYPAARVKEEEVTGYDIHNQNGGVSFVRGSRIPESLKPGSFMVPRYKRKELEVGLPFFIIERWHDIREYFQPSKGFIGPDFEYKSLEDAWNREIRFEYDAEQARQIDVMGEFPSKGVYLHFFTVKTPTFGYRPISEDVLDIVAATLDAEQQFASGKEYRIAIRDALAKMQAKRKQPVLELKEKIADAFNSAKVFGTPHVGWTPAIEKGTS